MRSSPNHSSVSATLRLGKLSVDIRQLFFYNLIKYHIPLFVFTLQAGEGQDLLLGQEALLLD